MKKTRQLKVGELVVLVGCPFDEQIPGEAMKYACLKSEVMKVLETRKVSFEGTSGQWIKVSKISGWIDKAWFTPVISRQKRSSGGTSGEV